MKDPMEWHAVKAYKIGKAALHLRKAFMILDELEDMNPDVDKRFKEILHYCSWLAMRYRQREKYELMRGNENRSEDYNKG